jgi:hypothetical protein
MTNKMKRVEQAIAAWERDPNYTTGGELERACNAARSSAMIRIVSDMLEVSFRRRCGA